MTTTDNSMQLAEAVERAKEGEDLQIRCPAHDDNQASLHVSPSAAGVLLNCFANCDTKAILDAVNLDWSALFHERDTAVSEDTWTPVGPASHVYQYTDEYGNLLYEVLRIPQGAGKTFRQRRPSGDPVRPWEWKLEGVRRVLYRLPQIIAAVRNGETIWIPEGEKDVRTLVERAKLNATTNAQGAGKWLPEYTSTLAGAEVILIADADEPGRAHARAVREHLIEAGCRVAIKEAPHPYKDVTALYDAGGTVDDLLTIVPFEEEQRLKFGIDVLDVIVRKVEATQFVVPNVLAHRERLLITGLEGHGKSTLLRQFGVQSAAGIHWFTGAECEPKKVLYIDAENEPGQVLQSWQDLLGLCARHGQPVDRGMLTVLEEWDNSELDLSAPSGTAWLHERVYAFQPDILLIGPLTNVVARDLKDDEPVRRLKAAINSARTISDCAIVMEHHAPHRNPSDKKRSVRPYGSSMFLKWPDYGYGMAPTDEKGVYEWQRTRWPRVRTRAWPEALRWGKPGTIEFPWVECELPG